MQVNKSFKVKLNFFEFQMTIDENETLSETPILDIEALFQKAESPHLPLIFYIFSAIWLCFTLFMGSLSNGAVILSFLRVQSVSSNFRVYFST